MTVRMGAALLGISVALAACSTPDGSRASFENAALDSNDQKASYGLGLNVGQQLSDASERLDRLAFMRGIEDALQGNDPDIDPAELQSVLQQFGQEIQAAAQANRAREAEENLAEGQAFLAENGARDVVVTTESGLQYEMLREGDGASPAGGEDVRLHYAGTLTDGTEFDWSRVTGDLFRVRSSVDQPDDAFVRVRYRNAWFYIDDSDLSSKSTFNLLDQLFQLQAGKTGGVAPMLTLPL